jgi:hypothetical protein
MRVAAARRGDRPGWKLRDLGVRRPGHRVRAGVGLVRSLHARGHVGEGPGRREKAGIPQDRLFATKPEIAIAQVTTLVSLGLRFFWVAADEVCGRSRDFRDTRRLLSLSYVVIIPCDYKVTLAKGAGPVRADEAPGRAVFGQRSAGNGTKGPRYSDRALLAASDPGEFLLIRRLDRGQNQYTYYLCHAAAGRPATLTYFVTIAGRRWSVETTFRPGRTRSAGTSPRPAPGMRCTATPS